MVPANIQGLIEVTDKGAYKEVRVPCTHNLAKVHVFRIYKDYHVRYNQWVGDRYWVASRRGPGHTRWIRVSPRTFGYGKALVAAKKAAGIAARSADRYFCHPSAGW